MGKFKKFAINENIDANNLFDVIVKKFSDKKLDGQIIKSLHDNKWNEFDGSVKNQKNFSILDKLNLPKTRKTGKIVYMSIKSNPIIIRLNDGTECKLTYDEYRRLPNEPKIGNTVSVEFQGSSSSNQMNHSNIASFQVIG